VRSRKGFTTPQDFVLISRNGTPIHPENIAARRLKPLGRLFQMPWLSWSDFQRTRLDPKLELIKKLHEEFENDRDLRLAMFPMLRVDVAKYSSGNDPSKSPMLNCS
jgi:hypothetical protein